jgi:release factor glutamine methyltransferase
VPGALVPRLRAAGCVFAEEEAAVLVGTGCTGSALETMVARRVAGEPLEHLVGWVDFAGLRLRVGPGVFVPRQRSVLLVEEALRVLPAAASVRRSGGPAVVELCCGAGAVSAALLAARPGLRVWASDIDPRPVACARANLPGARAVEVADLDEALPPELAGGVDLLVAHVPYVPTGRLSLLPPEARDHEPRAALDGGPDGLDLLRRVAARAGHWLRTGGQLLTEVGADQVGPASAAYRSCGLTPRVVRDDERGALVLAGRW